ncbi:hypothetical protein PSTT_10448 [Puccinia striiformis]|uniref:Uncharacterized protein n=1 Tax=Puccinia striiformis TaxID=27350 RepID=A0A2S4V4D0_9BASI|nr:hypothetical protein PSTT_10448 [Puccinia striiformis]
MLSLVSRFISVNSSSLLACSLKSILLNSTSLVLRKLL